MVNKKIIKQRKKLYGSNFTCIKNKWEFLFQKTISERDVAKAMALMKECRIEAIKEKISKTDDKIVLKKLNEALNDSITDMNNYRFIANNFEEYKNL
jgi:hypothetical protein